MHMTDTDPFSATPNVDKRARKRGSGISDGYISVRNLKL
jgi:hypothetical protein